MTKEEFISEGLKKSGVYDMPYGVDYFVKFLEQERKLELEYNKMQKQVKVYIATNIETGRIKHFKTMAEFSRKHDIRYSDIRNTQQTVQIKTGERFPFEIGGLRVELGVGEWRLEVLK